MHFSKLRIASACGFQAGLFTAILILRSWPKNGLTRSGLLRNGLETPHTKASSVRTSSRSSDGGPQYVGFGMPDRRRAAKCGGWHQIGCQPPQSAAHPRKSLPKPAIRGSRASCLRSMLCCQRREARVWAQPARRVAGLRYTLWDSAAITVSLSERRPHVWCRSRNASCVQ